MRNITIGYIIILAVSLASCEVKCSAGDNKSGVKTKTVTSSDNNALNGAIIKNDIELDATGVKVKEVYLIDANKNLLTENEAHVGEKIYVVIKLDTGWVKENGKSFVGASERISTKAGTVVLNTDDMFKDYDETGIDAEDAKAIRFSAVITSANSGVEDFVVQFRVWDKKGKGEVKGKYKFKLL